MSGRRQQKKRPWDDPAEHQEQFYSWATSPVSVQEANPQGWSYGDVPFAGLHWTPKDPRFDESLTKMGHRIGEYHDELRDLPQVHVRKELAEGGFGSTYLVDVKTSNKSVTRAVLKVNHKGASIRSERGWHKVGNIFVCSQLPSRSHANTPWLLLSTGLPRL